MYGGQMTCARATGWRMLILVLLTPLSTLAANYDENVDGDLSDLAGAPTALLLGLGANTVTATSERNDPDFLTISVPNGSRLDAIILDAFTGTPVSFVGVQNGPTWTEGTGTNIDPANLLGWAHFGENLAVDLLVDIGAGDGAHGFDPPLSSGDYTLLLQERRSAVTYAMNFNVSVPEPSSITLAATWLGWLVFFRRP